ncbi:MAG: hypothetical protein ACOX3K_03505 [Bacilli bacterium]
MFYGNNNIVNKFLESSGFYLALSIAVLIVALIVTFIVFNKRKETQVAHFSHLYISFLSAFGGKENVTALTARGSRVTVVLKKFSLFNAATLKDLGFENYVVMTTKITVVIGEKAKEFASTWTENLLNE